MSLEHDQTRRSLARVAGLALMVWGICWAAVWALAAIGLFIFGLWMGFQGQAIYFLFAAAAVIGGLILVAIGVGKAMAGWILVKEDRKL